MTVEQRPILRDADHDKSAYAAFAAAQFRILKDYMKVAKLNTYSRVVTLANGVVITCQKSFNREDIFISVPQAPYTEVVVKEEFVSGIIFHPRSGAIEMLPYTEYVTDELGSHAETKYLAGVKGGWQDGKTELTTPYIYPLVDADNASFVVTKPKEVLEGEFTGDTGNYGNLYWWNGDEKKPIYLSWKGTPSRHFRLPGSIEVPGFSTFETSRPGAWEDTPEYTAFGTKLYSQGRVLAEAPQWSWPYNGSGVGGRCLILGALQSTEGKIYIVTQSDHYYAPDNVFIFSDGHREEGAASLKNVYLTGKPDVTCVFEKALTKPGFFLALWEKGGVVGGWTLVSEVSYSRNGLPWFGNSVGTEFVCSNGDRLGTSGVLTGFGNAAGSWEETAELTSVVGAGNPIWPGEIEYHNVATMAFAADYQGKGFFEFQLLNLINATVGFAFNASSVRHSTESTTHTYTGLPMYVPEPEPLTITGTDYFVGGSWQAQGGQGVYTWVYPSVSSCGMGTVTVTDECGDNKSMQVRMPSGVWLLDPSLNYDFSSGITEYRDCISGNKKVSIAVQYTSHTDSVPGLQYNVISHTCIMGSNTRDLGFWSDRRKPYCGDYIKEVRTKTDTYCYTITYNIYWFEVYERHYTWVCP